MLDRLVLTSRRATLNGRHISPYMMGLTHELEQLRIDNQSSRSDGLGVLPRNISNSAAGRGKQQMVKVVTIARQISISRRDWMVDADEVAGAALLLTGIT